jgi:hypothetical protein
VGIDGLWAAALYALAVALRWPFLAAPAYGDEPMHFFMARHLLAPPGNFSDLFGSTWFHPSWIVYQRPLFYLGFHPAALASFAAFRVQGLLVGSLLPVVAYGLLRQHAVRRPFAVAAGLACAGFPLLVVWGTFGLMDTPMTVLLVAALWARRAGRPYLSALLLLAAVWTKETAYVAAAGLWGAAHLRRWLRGQAPLWPLQMDAAQSALLSVLLVGLLPITVAFASGLRMPGAAASGYGSRLLESLFGTAWVVPVVAMGLRWPTSRPLAAWGLLAGGFLLVLHGVLGRAVEVWYNVPAVTLAFIGAAAALDAALAAAPPPRRWAPAAGAVAVAALLLASMVVPESSAKDAWLHPTHPIPAPSWRDSLDYETRIRDGDLVQAAGWVAARPHDALLVFDVEYPHVLYPFVETEARVRGTGSTFFDILPQPLDAMAAGIESPGTLTLLQVAPTALNEAVQALYADCVVERNPTYLILEGASCPGRAQRLVRAVPYPHAP